MPPFSRKMFSVNEWLFLAGSILVIILLGRLDFLIFHTAVESFSIGIGILLFIIAWHTYPYARNRLLITLGCGYLWVSAADLLHTLTFEGVANFWPITPGQTIQHWIVGRFLEALTMVAAPIALTRNWSRGALFLTFGAIALILETAIFTGLFPEMFIQGEGLTPLKVLLEYLVMGLMALGAWILALRRGFLDFRNFALLLGAIGLTIVSELFFTLYSSLEEWPMLLGHLFKFASFWLIFLATIETSLVRPFSAMGLVFRAFGALHQGIIITRGTGEILQANPAAASIFYLAEEEMEGRRIQELLPDNYSFDQSKEPEEGPSHAELKGQGRRRTIPGIDRPVVSPQEFFINERVFEVTQENLGHVGLEGRPRQVHLFHDVTVRKEAEAKELKNLRQQSALGQLIELGLGAEPLDKKLQACLEALCDIPWISIESKGSLFLWNETEQLLEMKGQIGLDPPLLDLCNRIRPGHCLCGLAARDRKPVFRPHVDEDHAIDFPNMKPHGHYCIPIMAHGELYGVLNLYVRDGHLFDPDEQIFLGSVANEIAGIIQRGRNVELLAKFANIDPLTDFLNRRGFEQKLAHLIRRLRPEGSGKGILLFIDLDHFKHVNDTFGHDAGDELLVTISQRLQELLRDEDLIGRPGGDEFTVAALLPSVQAAGVLAHRIIVQVEQPVMLAEGEARVGASIGIAVFPDDADNLTDLLKCADTAMYHAKEMGRNRYAFFDGEVQKRALERQKLLEQLRGALARDELELFFQPQVELTNGVMIGAEVLLRWNHAELGRVSPAQFIPLAEESGLIVPIGDWVLETACRQAVAWREQGMPPLRIGVNLSPRQMREKNLVETVRRVLDRTGMDPNWLELEITESATEGREEELIAQTLNDLARMGIRLSIDDYGTGASSLKRLHRFPVSTLKIDQSFIQGLPDDRDAHTIVAATIALGRGLNMHVIAEGVETEAQRKALQELQCQEMQGYLYEPPLPREEFVRVLLENIAVQQLGEKTAQGEDLRRLVSGQSVR